MDGHGATKVWILTVTTATKALKKYVLACSGMMSSTSFIVRLAVWGF